MSGVVIIGAGRIGRIHAANLHQHPLADVRYIVDVVDSAASDLAASCAAQVGTVESALADNSVNIVESEKSAIIASIVYPEYIWIASGSRGNITDERMRIVKGRAATFYPDNDAFDDWENRANRYGCKIYQGVKEYCPDDEKADIADLILKFKTEINVG